MADEVQPRWDRCGMMRQGDQLGARSGITLKNRRGQPTVCLVTSPWSYGEKRVGWEGVQKNPEPVKK